jgi:hypothetical protein
MALDGPHRPERRAGNVARNIVERPDPSKVQVPDTTIVTFSNTKGSMGPATANVVLFHTGVGRCGQPLP